MVLIVISPAKTLDYESKLRVRKHSEPQFLDEAETLVAQLRKLKPNQLSALMNISSDLGQLNADRYDAWHTPFTAKNARQALFAFKGDVYQGLQAETLTAADLSFAQGHLRILSGLYGLLRPLDLIQPYRLEMGTQLQGGKAQVNVGKAPNLYAFWGRRLTDRLNEEFAATSQPKVLVNLASQEYFGALRPKDLDAELVSPVFKDLAGGKYRVVSFFAKRARGAMAAWIIRERLRSARRLPEFAEDGYRYCAEESTPARPVFLRRTRPGA